MPNLPVPLTRFVGRDAEVDEVARLLTASRLVTLSGAGGIGKTRLAVQLASEMASGFEDGVFLASLAPVAHAELVAVTVARGFGLPDQPGRSAVETLVRFVGDRHLLLLLDNCEHLLDASAALVDALLGACPNSTVLATSREPIGVSGEVTWRVPSLSVTEGAVELFTDRARSVRPSFSLTDANTATVTEICRRLDGMPLAIEFAAARVRALSPAEILSGLEDRFRLLTGGARTVVPRQQTLRASVDWSHALLTPTEGILLRRLAVFMGGFQLDACQAVAADDDLERDQVLDLLTQLVDKSLVVADESTTRTRYRLLETVREYAFEKLTAAGEADALRTRHRDFYNAFAAGVDDRSPDGQEQSLELAVVELDNCRAAFTWSMAASDSELALTLASSLQPLWLSSGRMHEGLAWFDAVLSEDGGHHAGVSPPVRVRALVDRTVLYSWAVGIDSTDGAEHALAAARDCGDRALLARALTARAIIATNHGGPVDDYFAEAAEVARAVGDRWRLSQILGWQTTLGFLAGDPIAALAAAAEGTELAESIGDRFSSRQCRTWGGWAHTVVGELDTASTQLGAVSVSAKADHDMIWWIVSAHYRAQVALYRGDSAVAQAELIPVMPGIAEFGVMWSGNSNGVRALAALAEGDVGTAEEASRAAWEQLNAMPNHQQMHAFIRAEAALARGDAVTANDWADKAVAVATGWYRVLSLTTRARVRLVCSELELAEGDAFDALGLASNLCAHLGVSDALECLASAGVSGSHPRAARLLGAAESVRRRIGTVRFTVHDGAYRASVSALRNAMGDESFDEAFAEGAALDTQEVIAYALRGKGARKRPATGWAALTPAERDVVRLVCEGLSTKAIAKRLLVSPRTVQTHLTHVYTKLSLNSRVQLVHEASHHDD